MESNIIPNISNLYIQQKENFASYRTLVDNLASHTPHIKEGFF